ncbi:MAG TPA: sulfite exporter TauE/SafE family protein [Polyangia bacterium]
MHAALAYLLVVVFVATLIRSALGFGEALVAVPLLALRMPIAVAAPLAVLVSITIAAIVVARDWRDVHARSAGWLVLATLPGIPLGLWLLTAVDGRLVKAGLALVILAFAIYALARRTPARLDRDRLGWLIGCGLCAGVLGGAYGMNGPPLVVYGSLRSWPAARFRATLQAYFLPASMIGMAGYWMAGLWSPTVSEDFLLVLPAIAVGVVAGRMINRRLAGRSFSRWVHGGLIVTSVALLAQALSAT